MAVLIVARDQAQVDADEGVLLREEGVLLREEVHLLHLTDMHAAEQVVERIAWAVQDAEGIARTAVQDYRNVPAG